MFSYKPLEILMVKRGVNRTKLEQDGVLARNTIAKFRKGQYVSLEVLDRLCTYFNVPVSEIIEWIPDENKKPHNE